MPRLRHRHALAGVVRQSTSELDEQIWKVRKQLDIEVLANRESEEFLKRKQQLLQQEIQKWMQRYDHDTEEQEKELDTLKASRAEDLVKLNDYTERYTKEMEEKARREEEARIRAEMEALRKQEEERNAWAATRVQALWRGYLARKAASGGKGKKGETPRQLEFGTNARPPNAAADAALAHLSGPSLWQGKRARAARVGKRCAGTRPCTRARALSALPRLRLRPGAARPPLTALRVVARRKSERCTVSSKTGLQLARCRSRLSRGAVYGCPGTVADSGTSGPAG